MSTRGPIENLRQSVSQYFNSLVNQVLANTTAYLDESEPTDDEKSQVIQQKYAFIKQISQVKSECLTNLMKLSKHEAKALSEMSEDNEDLCQVIFKPYCVLLTKKDAPYFNFKSKLSAALGYLLIFDQYVLSSKLTHFKQLLAFKHLNRSIIIDRGSIIRFKARFLINSERNGNNRFIIRTREKDLFVIDKLNCRNVFIPSLNPSLIFIFKYTSDVKFVYKLLNSKLETNSIKLNTREAINNVKHLLNFKDFKIEKAKLTLEVNDKQLPVNQFHNMDKLVTLSIRGRSLEEITTNSFNQMEHLSELKLSRNSIISIKPNSFMSLEKLRFLKLDDNRLTKIEKDWFNGLVNLEKLDLSYNYITSIEKNALVALNCLKYLDLRGNQIETIDKDIFRGLGSLKGLNIGRNKINKIEQYAFSNLTELKYLYIFENEIELLSKKTFKGLVSLVELDMCQNKLVSLEEGVFSDLGQLKALDMAQNQIELINENAFDGLTNLEELDLSDNQILIVEDSVFSKLEKLKSLKISPTEEELFAIMALNKANGEESDEESDLSSSSSCK